MPFIPSSTIYLCNVPFDNTYKHQIYFPNVTAQGEYFASNRVRKMVLTNYQFVRKTSPSGGYTSSIKVGLNIDELHSNGINYMYYRNMNYEDKVFYAFITNYAYINENTTELFFETDVYQTWRFNVTLLPSYVEREHSVSDKIGDNLVPEPFNFQDYVYNDLTQFDELDDWGYLITSTKDLADTDLPGTLHSGLYQGLYFYYYEKASSLNNAIETLHGEDSFWGETGDTIISITVIPKFNVSNSTRYDPNATILPDIPVSEGKLMTSSKPAEKTINVGVVREGFSFGGYYPMCRKLYTAPFFMLDVSNHSGEHAEYYIEDFKYPENIQFKLYGDVSVNPSVTLIPLDYKGIKNNYDSGISIGGFPQASFNSDTFKLWLAKNQFGLVTSTLANVGSIAAGGAMAIGGAVTGVGAVVGGATVLSGVTGIINTFNQVYQASREPNKANTGNAKNNLLTAMKMNTFSFYIRTLKHEYAETIDQFFHMYGYQTNKVKVPNVSSRPYFNYVKTIDVNISGDIPSDDMRVLKSMYNNGVTLWKHNVTFGEYNEQNNPKYM